MKRYHMYLGTTAAVLHTQPNVLMAILKRVFNEKVRFAQAKHTFHIVRPSAFPFLVGLSLEALLSATVFFLHGQSASWVTPAIILVALIGLVVTVMAWFVEIIHESAEGSHTPAVVWGLKLGMLLFIVSEVMFFFAFFWSFFHYSLTPSTAIGAVWPPAGLAPVNAWGLPLFNTLLLLASGGTITLAHAAIVKKQKSMFTLYLFYTIILGLVFLVCQAFEYKHGVTFSWRDNVYGSIFFITTGFHGFHVTIGALFLLFCLVRHVITSEKENSSLVNAWGFTAKRHFGFEAAAWYWHFVDVVWLFLFITIYWWGGA